MSKVMRDSDREIVVQWIHNDVPGFNPRPIRDRLGEPLDADAEPRVLHGRPCLLYADMDYAEEWSGEHIAELLPYCLVLDAKPLTVVEFWALVRTAHGAP